MQIVLHIGAHRTGTTVFQAATENNSAALKAVGTAVWSPKLVRKSLFRGAYHTMHPPKPDAEARLMAAGLAIVREIDELETEGYQTLLISEENMSGTCRANIRNRSLYGDISDWLDPFATIFDPEVATVALCVRSYDSFWASSFAYMAGRGMKLPERALCSQIARSERRWTDVVHDVCATFPRTKVRVIAFEDFVGRQKALFEAITGTKPGTWTRLRRKPANAAPDAAKLAAIFAAKGQPSQIPQDENGGFMPFTTDERAAMQQAYRDDLEFLATGQMPGVRLVAPPNTHSPQAKEMSDER